MIAGLITVLALFRLAAKHYGNTIGMTAAAAFICSPAIRYAWENRPVHDPHVRAHPPHLRLG